MKNPLFISSRCRIQSGDHKLRILVLKPVGKKEEGAPGVLWIHGGGYQSGSSREVYVTRAISLVVKFGMVLVAPDYRLSKKHPYPAGLQNCYAALLWMKDHAADLGIRTDQIMIGGESAGGGMTAALCMLARDRGTVNIAFQMPVIRILPGITMPETGTQRETTKHGNVIFARLMEPVLYRITLRLRDAPITGIFLHAILMSEMLNLSGMKRLNT